MINHNQNPFSRVSYCFRLFGEFEKVFERQVRVAHLHSAARALSSPSRCFQSPFQLSTNLDKDLSDCFLCWDARTGSFHQRQKAINIMCFFHIVKLYTAKIKYTRSFDNSSMSSNKIEIFIRVDERKRNRNFAYYFCRIHIFSA